MDEESLKNISEKLKSIKAVDIMSRFAITTSEDTTVNDLAHLFMRFKIGSNFSSGIPYSNSFPLPE